MKTPLTAKMAKALIATAAAGAMAVSSASPAYARDRGNGIDAGDVIAGVLVLGGIAAIAAAASKNNRNDRYDGNYRYDRAGYNYGNSRYGYGDPNQAARMCASAAEQNASRVSWGGSANVTDIRSVRQTSKGYKVKGNIAVNSSYRGNANYNRGYSNNRGYDTGTFSCEVRQGRITDIDYKGIRGL